MTTEFTAMSKELMIDACRLSEELDDARKQIAALESVNRELRRDLAGTVRGLEEASAALTEAMDALRMFRLLSPTCHRGVTNCGECASCKAARLLN